MLLLRCPSRRQRNYLKISKIREAMGNCKPSGGIGASSWDSTANHRSTSIGSVAADRDVAQLSRLGFHIFETHSLHFLKLFSKTGQTMPSKKPLLSVICICAHTDSDVICCFGFLLAVSQFRPSEGQMRYSVAMKGSRSEDNTLE